MTASRLQALLVVALAGACGSGAEGQPGSDDTVRVAVGMPVAELNAQPAVARQGRLLDPLESGVFVMADDHRVILELNGRQIPFQGGGEWAPTYIASGYRIENSLEGIGRIRSVSFTTTPELMTLPDVLALARDRCAAVRAAGLSPRKLDPRYAIISESIGRVRQRMLAEEAELIAAFTDTQMRVRRVALCTLEDRMHAFELTITNTRRAARALSGGGSEADVLTERVYTLSVYFAQNLSETGAGSPRSK